MGERTAREREIERGGWEEKERERTAILAQPVAVEARRAFGDPGGAVGERRSNVDAGQVCLRAIVIHLTP